MYRGQVKLIATQSGMTLLEVMLTLSLSLLITTALTTLYLHLHHAALHQQSLQSHQRDARRIKLLLTDEIAAAGHIGCARLSSSFSVIPYLEYSLTAKNALESEDSALTLRYQSFPGATLMEANSHPSRLIVDLGLRFYPKQIGIISDCLHAEVFQVKAVRLTHNTQVIETMLPLHFSYQPYAELGHYRVHRYLLQHSQLVRIDLGQRKNIMMEGIVDLHFSDDGMGISYQFVTSHQSSLKIWSGYAARS
jgi:hypothetical protein